jgi:hypothetical protein
VRDWFGRLARGWRLDRNPLRRTSDRVETLILAGLLAVLLGGGPFAAAAGGGFAHDLAVRVQRAQFASERQVIAVTTQPAPLEIRGIGLIYAEVPAHWTAPDGTAVRGQVPVFIGTPAGAREPVWTTMNGKLAAPPLLESDVSSIETLGQLAAAAALITAFLVSWLLARRELDRRRYAAWDADWQAIDPRGKQHK